MQNSGQNRIFYKVDETHLTRDPDDPDSLPLCREIKCPVHVFNSGSPLIEAPCIVNILGFNINVRFEIKVCIKLQDFVSW